MLQPGVVIGGRFRVDRTLGAGGMGVVVQATHVELGQQVALKVLHDELATNPMIVARFLREAKAVATLRTDHVCRVFDVGRLDSGAPFIVMEMLDGTDLTAAALKGVPMTIAVEYVIQACVALAEAHAAGLVHRDIKPPNLFVVRKPDGGPLVKVLDFGIAKAATAAEAKLTHTTSTMGSPGYMSPEQIRSTRDVDLRTDIWALGVTLYQLLSGRMPFPGTQLAEIAVAVMTAAPPPLQVDPALAAIVMRCLEKEPDKRFASVAELAVALMPFGGPSAPRFVREITRGAVGGVVPPLAAIVPQHAPTAASMVAPMPLTGLTGMTGMTGMTRPTGMTGPVGMTSTQGPLAHVPLATPPHSQVPPALAQGTSPHGPPMTAAPPSKRGLWIVLGIVVVVVLVGGGALAGYLARGTSPTAVDAGAAPTVAAPVDTGAAPTATDPVVTAPDAGAVASDAIDHWSAPPSTITEPSGTASETADDGELPEVSAMARMSVEMARNAMSPAQKKQLAEQMKMMERSLEKTRRTNPDYYQQQVAALLMSACLLADVEAARRAYARLEDPTYRDSLRLTCHQYGVPLDRAPPKKM